MAEELHAHTAQRYMRMCETLDMLLDTYHRIVPRNQAQQHYPPELNDEHYLITHLRHLVTTCLNGRRRNFRCRTAGVTHQCAPLSNSNKLRISVPSTIAAAIRQIQNPPWQGKRFELRWVIAYLHDIYPDQNQHGWRFFENSHRCISRNGDGHNGSIKLCDIIHHPGARHGWDCIDVDCMVWESKAVNQSRGHLSDVCLKTCHCPCNQTLCIANNIHNPPCK